MRQIIQIAGVTIEVVADFELLKPLAFIPFLDNVSSVQWTICLEESQELCCPLKVPVFCNQDYCVYSDEQRLYFDQKNQNIPYALVKTFENTITLKYLPNKKKYLNEWGNLLFHIGWERIMMLHNIFILHSACIDTQYGGIVFTGPSGIGKSTQAGLWCEYEKAELINGDRTLIKQGGELGWSAWGSPYAGSSKCHKNQSCAIRAVVVLRQGKENEIRILSKADAFKKLFSQTTIYSWDEQYVNTVIEMENLFVNKIVVFELTCIPDKSAVEILKSFLITQ